MCEREQVEYVAPRLGSDREFSHVGAVGRLGQLPAHLGFRRRVLEIVNRRDDGGSGSAGAFCDAVGLARFKWPERVEILDALPRNPLMKIDRRALAARLAPEGANG